MQIVVPEKKRKLIEAAMSLILRHGYAATSVDDVCGAAGVTKGSFFYYFTSKEEICVAAMATWVSNWCDTVRDAKLDEIADPLDRLDARFRMMEAAYLNPDIEPGCVVGIVAQECSLPNDRLRAVCDDHFETWINDTAKLLAEAKATYPPRVDFDPEEVAWWLLSFVQGTMLVIRTQPDRSIVTSNIKHCRAYVQGLFDRERTQL